MQAGHPTPQMRLILVTGMSGSGVRKRLPAQAEVPHRSNSSWRT